MAEIKLFEKNVEQTVLLSNADLGPKMVVVVVVLVVVAWLMTSSARA